MGYFGIDMNDFLLSYDTVCLRPKYSELPSRVLANTKMDFLGYQFNLPVVPANMEDVISFNNAKELDELGCFYIMHRFRNSTVEFSKYAKNVGIKIVSISLGVNKDSMDDLRFIVDNTSIPHFITVDVAHGHHIKTKEMVEFIRSVSPSSKVILGNVATKEGYEFLCDLGADAVKVGIGGGSICTTRFKTGFHLPTLQSVYEAIQSGRSVPIIADGGAKHHGDIAKALTIGATMVMSGGWFASCIDSPAKIVDGKKIYRGSTSFDSKGEHRHIEGRTLALEEGFTYKDRLREIQQDLQSSISYAGGNDLSCFSGVKWERLQPGQ